METKRRRDSGAPRADRTKKMCNLACSRLTDSGEDAKVFFFSCSRFVNSAGPTILEPGTGW